MQKSLDDVKNAISDFVTGLSDDLTRMALIGFGDKVKIYRDLTNDTNQIITAVNELKVNELGRGTDASPLGAAHSVLDSAKGAKMIVILTDGIWGKRDRAVDEAIECRHARISIVAVGFADADTSFLKQIATVEEGAMFTTLSNLGSAFSTIASAINSGSMGLRES